MEIDGNYVGEFNVDDWDSTTKDKLKLHKCKDGTLKCINGTHPKYDCMMNDHLLNTIRWIEKKAKIGINLFIGGGTCADDMWGDIEKINGKKARKYMNYKIYIKEAKKRKLII